MAKNQRRRRKRKAVEIFTNTDIPSSESTTADSAAICTRRQFPWRLAAKVGATGLLAFGAKELYDRHLSPWSFLFKGEAVDPAITYKEISDRFVPCGRPQSVPPYDPRFNDARNELSSQIRIGLERSGASRSERFDVAYVDELWGVPATGFRGDRLRDYVVTALSFLDSRLSGLLGVSDISVHVVKEGDDFHSDWENKLFVAGSFMEVERVSVVRKKDTVDEEKTPGITPYQLFTPITRFVHSYGAWGNGSITPSSVRFCYGLSCANGAMFSPFSEVLSKTTIRSSERIGVSFGPAAMLRADEAIVESLSYFLTNELLRALDAPRWVHKGFARENMWNGSARNFSDEDHKIYQWVRYPMHWISDGGKKNGQYTRLQEGLDRYLENSESFLRLTGVPVDS